jgi:hypothetical protein
VVEMRLLQQQLGDDLIAVRADEPRSLFVSTNL